MPEGGSMGGAGTLGASSDNPFVNLSSRKGRSMLGKQADSKKATAPMYSFGAGTDRDKASKVFLSQAHLNSEKCRTSPGAIYQVGGAMDKQVDSLKPSASRYSFSKTGRFKGPEQPNGSSVPPPGQYEMPSALGAQPNSLKMSLPQHSFSPLAREQTTKQFLGNDFVRENRGTLGADPGAYNVPGSMGSQPSSPKRSNPSYSLYRTDRLKDMYEKAAESMPPVGAYETWNSMGKQPLSLFKSLPSWAFGSSSWTGEEKRFITAGHATRTNMGAATANFNSQTEASLTSFGKQPLSTRTTGQGFRFGSSELGRLAPLKPSDVPGPGMYDN